MRTVVLDTNILLADPRLSSPSLQLLAGEAPRLDIGVAVPVVVLQEFEHHVLRKCEAASEEAHRAFAVLQRFGSNAQPKFEGAGEIASTARTDLELRLKGIGGSILPLPPATHETLLGRALRKHAPFDDRGRGYVDALIWETILEYLRVDRHHVTLISADGDFAEKDALRQRLVDDVTILGLPPTQVDWAKGVEQFVDQEVRPLLESLADAKVQLERPDHPSRRPLVEGVVRSLDTPDWGGQVAALAADPMPGLWSGIEEESAKAEGLAILDVRRAATSLLITAELMLEVRASGIWQTSSIFNPQIFPLFANPLDVLNVVSQPVQIRTRFQARLAPDTLAVAGVEILMIERSSWTPSPRTGAVTAITG